jgi:hypothetical protein
MRSRVISSSAPNELVHQQQLGALGQRPGDRDALLHASGELVGIVPGEVGQPDQLEQLRHAGAALCATGSVQRQGQLDVAGHGLPGQESGLLERDAVVLVESRLASRLAEDAELSRRRGVEVGDEPQQGALAAAAGSDQRHELPRCDAEVDRLERCDGRAPAPAERTADAAHLNCHANGFAAAHRHSGPPGKRARNGPSARADRTHKGAVVWDEFTLGSPNVDRA